MPNQLTALNGINVATYLANTAVTYGSQLGWFGPTNSQQSLKYQTLVTPVGYAFAIWGPIFVLQALFTFAQLLPSYRADPEVQQGVGYWYTAACVAQFGWTVSFAQDLGLQVAVGRLRGVGCGWGVALAPGQRCGSRWSSCS